MTLIVGIQCRDGVVMASDSAATFGVNGQATIGQQVVQKIRRLNDHIIYSATGAVGISQVIADAIKTQWEAKAFAGATSPDAFMDKLGKMIGQIVGPYLQTAGLQRQLTGDASTSLCKSLIAIPVAQQPHLFQFDFNGAPERATTQLPFVALGSGQTIADPFLALLHRLLWSKSEPTIAEGRLAAVWTIEHVCQTNPGGVGGGIQLATLVKRAKDDPTVEVAETADVEEHRQRIVSAEGALLRELRSEPTSEHPLPKL